MKVLVTGAGGMLGQALLLGLREEGFETIGADRAMLDVTDAAAVTACLYAHRPHAVLQCAAYTAVDAAEADRERAYLLNEVGARNVARACQKIGALLVYPSTDYVFPGTSTRPYRPTDPPEPLNVYGASKLAGERAAQEAGRTLIVRTSWLYGAGGRNFVDTIAGLVRERKELEVVSDQVGRPTWTVSLAGIITRLLKIGAEGTFHATDGGALVSWHGLALEIANLCRADVVIRAVDSEAVARPARRPKYSALDLVETEVLLGSPIRPWRESLSRYLASRGI